MKWGDFFWLAVFSGITALLIIPETHRIFVELTNTYPYMMGFVKFAIMATMGELLSIRIISGKWEKTPGMVYKAVIWGIVGMLIVLMFGIFSFGVEGCIKSKLLFAGNEFFAPILSAFFISAIMNLTFAPVFMAAHRMTDTYIEMRTEGLKTSWSDIIDKIDWKDFIRFVVGRIVPFFWIPMHTITFFLPSEYRVLMAAYLSIALGVILYYAGRRKSAANIMKIGSS